MKLQGVHAGDLVLVDDGLQYYAEVLEVLNRELVVRPLYGNERGRRRVKARRLERHWRLSRVASRGQRVEAAA